MEEVRHVPDQKSKPRIRLGDMMHVIIREYVESIAIAAVLTTFIVLFVARSFIVEGISMRPTLEDRQRLLVEEVTYRIRAPRRGDIIVFNQDGNKRLIKRVIGVPGDLVEIKNGRLSINSSPVEEDFINENAWNEWDDYGPVVVPENKFFVLGDNRNHSDDSRGSVGLLPRQLIVGRAFARFWPVNRLTYFTRPRVYRMFAND